MNKFTKYFLISIIFWIVVDYTTAFNPDFKDWLNHMPLVWIFYIGYPLLFAFLIYKLNFAGKKLFFIMSAVSLLLELIVFHNTPIFIPLIILIYGFITYAPKWITENSVRENKGKFIFLAFVWFAVAILSFIDRIKN